MNQYETKSNNSYLNSFVGKYFKSRYQLIYIKEAQAVRKAWIKNYDKLLAEKVWLDDELGIYEETNYSIPEFYIHSALDNFHEVTEVEACRTLMEMYLAPNLKVNSLDYSIFLSDKAMLIGCQTITRKDSLIIADEIIARYRGV